MFSGGHPGHLHAEMQAHGRQHFLDLVQRLAAEVRRAQHLAFALLHQVADVDDVVVLEAVRRTDRKLQLVDLAQQVAVERQVFLAVGEPSGAVGSWKLMKTCSWSCMMRAA